MKHAKHPRQLNQVVGVDRAGLVFVVALVAGGVSFGGAACSSQGSAGPGAAGASGSGTAGSGNPSGAAGSGDQSGVAGTGPSGAAGSAGTTGVAGGTGAGQAGTAGPSGAGGQAGTSMTGAGGSSVAGANGTGAAGQGAAGTGAGGTDAGDTPPWRLLHVTATAAAHLHGKAGMDGRATLLGKLAVDLGVSGGNYEPWLSKRGYHSMGVSYTACNVNDWTQGRDVDDKCRESEWVTISANVKATLTSLESSNPEEDWGYFLNQDGSVRWSDVAMTGVSHGATTAAYIGRVDARLWRAVSRSGPRDNTCGIGMGTAPFDPNNPPWHPVAATCDGTHCCLGHIATWIDKPSLTPMNRFYGLTGTTDVEYGDIMFNMDRTMYPGAPIQWNVAGAVLTGGNRFYSSEGGHLDWLEAANVPINTEAVLDLAFAIPVANQNPTF